MIDRDEVAGRLIEDLRDRDDIVHVARYDYDNKQIEIIVDAADIDNPEETFFPADILERVANAGFGAVSAGYSANAKHPDNARVMGFKRQFE